MLSSVWLSSTHRSKTGMLARAPLPSKIPSSEIAVYARGGLISTIRPKKVNRPRYEKRPPRKNPGRPILEKVNGVMWVYEFFMMMMNTNVTRNPIIPSHMLAVPALLLRLVMIPIIIAGIANAKPPPGISPRTPRAIPPRARR